MTDKPEITVDKEFLDDLDVLAAAATPGPWWIDNRYHSPVGQHVTLLFGNNDNLGFLMAVLVGAESGDADFIAAASSLVVQALVKELRVREKALETAAAPFRLFCHNVGGQPRCPLFVDAPPGECSPGININSDECNRLRIEHAYREAHTQLEADHE